MSNKHNIALLLSESAEKYPARRAVIYPDGRDRCGRVAYSHLTFLQLERLSNAYAAEFARHGIKKGVRTLVMLRPGLDFIAVAFALFKLAAVPVLIDPGMGRKNLIGCIRDTAPEAVIAISPALWAAKLFPSAFKSVRTYFSLGRFSVPGAIRLEKTAEALSDPANSARPYDFKVEDVEKDDVAAILFTTGSTGPPKGVVYTHGIFMAQVDIIMHTYGSGPSEIDMAVFPLFALFSAGMGMTCVIPDMDPTKPAKADPKKIIEAVNNQNVSFSFGSPALWRLVASYCLRNNIKLPTLKKVLMAGAPVSAELHAMLKDIISPDGDTMVPYGATESLPVASFNGSEMLFETASLTLDGKGFCVGRPLEGITIKIIKAVDEEISLWNENLALPDGQRGEIVIKGEVVTPSYFNKESATKLAKIKDPDGRLWHRMGDVGYFDEKGRLWFCGRKAHRVIDGSGKIFYTVCCEAIFNKHPDVFRTALVAVGKPPRPVITVEPKPGKMPLSDNAMKRFANELRALALTKDFTSDIKEFLFHPAFPVDIRHNAKIFREKLSVWASEKLK